jgi:hypothetical protein
MDIGKAFFSGWPTRLGSPPETVLSDSLAEFRPADA